MGYIDRTDETSQYTTNLRGNRVLDRRNPNRNVESIDSIVLHNMGFHRSGEEDRYDRVIAHWAVLLNGLVLKLRGENLDINASHSLNAHSIAIEFEGKFPGINRNLFTQRDCNRHGYDYPTKQQIHSGRQLIRHLIGQFTNISYIYGHVQVAHKHCPGPHIWYNVGKWAKECLGLVNDLPPDANRFRRLIPVKYCDLRYNIFNTNVPFCTVADEMLMRRVRRIRELQVCGESPIEILQRNNFMCE